jgi:8-oxo-dGTP pyrophosphatase MutT (NUDIX family)
MSESQGVARPRDAATVVVARDAPGGLEVFCVERHARSGFMGGALVFPGGKVDAEDSSPQFLDLTTNLDARARAFAADETTARSYAVAALREALEEAAILPVVGNRLDANEALALRAACRTCAFADAIRERNLVLDTARLTGFSRWITPTAEPKRFDTRFYLLALPSGQSGAHDDHETTRSLWATPNEVLTRWARGEVMLAPPTSWVLSLFSRCETVHGAFAAARETSLSPVEPRFLTHEGEMILTLPGDPLHEPADATPLGPDAPTRFILENGRFVPKRHTPS